MASGQMASGQCRSIPGVKDFEYGASAPLPDRSRAYLYKKRPAFRFAVYFGIRPADLDARRPRREQSLEPMDPAFEVAFLDPERRLPLLVPKAA